MFALHKMLMSLDEIDKKIFYQQLKRLDLVQRSPNGKIVALFQRKDTYFRRWNEILLSNRSENYLAYRIKVSGDICPKKNLMIEVFTHQGRISSIEFKSKMAWPKGQEKVPLGELDWMAFELKDINVISAELLI